MIANPTVATNQLNPDGASGKGSCAGSILQSTSSSSYTMLPSGRLLLTSCTMSDFWTESEGPQPFASLVLYAPPPQRSCSQCLPGEPNEFLAKQMAKFTGLSRSRVVPSGHSSILEIDPVTPLDIDYLPVEYCFDRSFNFPIPSRSNWTPDTTGSPGCLYRRLQTRYRSG